MDHEVSAIRDVRRDVKSVVTQLNHPECVAWHNGEVYCGTEDGKLLAIAPSDGSTRTAAVTDGSLCGIAFGLDGACYACDIAHGRVLRITAGGEVDTFADTVEGTKLNLPNYPAFGSDGTLWITESGTAWGSDDGYLFRIRSGRDPERVDDSCHRFPNGLALSPDENRLYVVESRWPGVCSYALRNGELGAREATISLPRTVPDGLAFNAAGDLFICCWRPDRVYRYASDGELGILLDDWTGEYLTTPTNACFGGKNLETLYFAGLGGWSISALEGEGPGLPLPPR